MIAMPAIFLAPTFSANSRSLQHAERCRIAAHFIRIGTPLRGVGRSLRCKSQRTVRTDRRGMITSPQLMGSKASLPVG